MEKNCKNSVEKDCMSIYFPDYFSIMKYNGFIDNIADASQILFSKTVYAVCDTVEKANKIVSDANGVQFGENEVAQVLRLGPAFSIMRNNVYKTMKHVLTINNMPVTSYKFVMETFPSAIDVCIKKKMAVVLFKSEDEANLAYFETENKKWTTKTVPKINRMLNKKKKDIPVVEEETDPEVLVHGHPNKYIRDACVVCINLSYPFELKSQMKLLDTLKAADDIMLSRSCSVMFKPDTNVWQRRKILEGLDIGGKKVVVWVRTKRNRLEEDETEDEENEAEDEEENEAEDEEENEAGNDESEIEEEDNDDETKDSDEDEIEGSSESEKKEPNQIRKKFKFSPSKLQTNKKNKYISVKIPRKERSRKLR